LKACWLSIAAVLILCGQSFAQERPSKGPEPSRLTPPQKVLPNKEDSDLETQNRLNRLAQMRREHSDATGKLRPDLFAKGLAQMRRMKVVHQIGGGVETQPGKQASGGSDAGPSSVLRVDK
jgi:hypothetical protein